MSSPVFIAGAGIISAIGNNIAENLAALENGASGMDKMQYLRSAHRDKLPVAEVKMSNTELAELAGMPPHTTRTALLSAIAAKEAQQQACIENFDGLRTGFISANTVGGMDKTEDFFPAFFKRPEQRQVAQYRSPRMWGSYRAGSRPAGHKKLHIYGKHRLLLICQRHIFCRKTYQAKHARCGDRRWNRCPDQVYAQWVQHVNDR